MMAERLDIWRLSNFALERLPSADDVYLLRAVARANPRDERLVAVAEVRDLTPVRDEAGRITGAARSSSACCARRSRRCAPCQSRRPPRQRLLWNRLLLYAWQVIDFSPEEARAVIAPLRAPDDGARARAGAAARADARGRRDPRPRAAHLQPDGPARRGRARRSAAQPLQPLDEGAQRIVSARRRGTAAPGRDRQAAGRRPRRVRRARPRRATASWCRSTGRRRRTRRASWSA